MDAYYGESGRKKEAAELLATDACNLVRLKQITRRYGFPKAADVGHDGVAAAWLLVQHAEADPVFQQQILSQLDALARPRASAANRSRS